MNKILKLFILFLLCISAPCAKAQQKYALLVGINKYYDKPGVLHGSALGGCVNDALAMKAMLIRRFGFDDKSVHTLFDAAATKANVVAAFTEILNKSNPGDAVIFYFSGHGVWMDNRGQDSLDRAVKDGMNQAMVMSDLYADSLNCLFTDAAVKKMFNKFVDKKVILTAVFDCCFSGNMSMVGGQALSKNPYELETEGDDENKSLPFSDLYNIWDDYSRHNQQTASRNNINEILMVELAEDEQTRSFNLKDAITINDPTRITRPSERPYSGFLSLSATSDVQPALEITDESGQRHGAFTKALLQTIQDNSSNISVSELIKKVPLEMKRQMYTQDPMHHEDAGRLNKNLLGIAPVNFSNTITVACTTITGKQLQLDAGLTDGLAKGNIFSKAGNNKITVRITGITENSAVATAVTGDIELIKAGDQFIRTDVYTESPPVLKVFIPTTNMTATEFNSFINKKIIPLTRLENYMDYENWYAYPPSENIFFNDPAFNPDKKAQDYLVGKRTDSFLVFLPVPDFIATPVKNSFRKNQDIQIVNTAAEADLVLQLNYIKQQKNTAPHFIFTWYQFKGSEINGLMASLKFNARNVKTASAVLNPQQAGLLTTEISNMTSGFIRAKSSRWLSDYPARN